MDERKLEEELRARYRQLKDSLAAMPPDDPRRQRDSARLREVIFQIRDLLSGQSRDVCSVPKCVIPGTETVEGRQWCPFHASPDQLETRIRVEASLPGKSKNKGSA